MRSVSVSFESIGFGVSGQMIWRVPWQCSCRFACSLTEEKLGCGEIERESQKGLEFSIAASTIVRWFHDSLSSHTNYLHTVAMLAQFSQPFSGPAPFVPGMARE